MFFYLTVSLVVREEIKGPQEFFDLLFLRASELQVSELDVTIKTVSFLLSFHNENVGHSLASRMLHSS